MERIVILCSGFLILSSSLQVFAEDALESATALPPSDSPEHQNVDLAAEALFDEFWQMNLMEHPEIATSVGDHRYDDRLDSYSLKCYEKRKVMMTEFLERASQLHPLVQEGTMTYNNIQMFIAMLQFKIDRLTDGSYLFPVSKMYTPKMNLRFLLKYIKFKNAKNYWDLIARYRAFPQQIDEIIELMREGIRTNYTLSEYSLWSTKGEENPNATESPFYEPFQNISSSVSTEEANFIQSNASDVISNSLHPALKKLDDFIEDEYRPHARKEIGVSSLPDGSEFYRQELIVQMTDRTVTAEAMHALGLEEVQRINQEMNEVVQSLGLNLTREEFNFKLRNDDTNFFSSQEEALETYRDMILNVISQKLPLVFKKIPQMALNVEKVPADLAGGPWAFYMAASPDNSTPATFYLDTRSLKSLSKHEVIPLSLHEGNPGHHFQFSYAMERNDIPEFQKHDYSSTAFIEGWGLYSEYLGKELGLYEDPYMRYGHLSLEMFRACRMVVDTGIHAFGWSRQRAIDFMVNNTATPLENIEREVNRYITWPGQACAYKYGQLKIKELRRRAESALGDNFDVKEFHDVILRNNGPLELLEKQVDYYIQSVNSASDKGKYEKCNLNSEVRSKKELKD